MRISDWSSDVCSSDLRVFPEYLYLVGIVHVGRQGGGQKFGRVIMLEPGRLVSDQGIGGRVAFVEAVAGEFFHQVEQLDGQLGVVALFDRALFEEDRKSTRLNSSH